MDGNNWREGLLLDSEVIEIEHRGRLLLEAFGMLTTTGRFGRTTLADIGALTVRLDSLVCDFQVEMRDGNFYAGRSPLEDGEDEDEMPEKSDEEITGKTAEQVMAELDSIGYKKGC